MRLRHCSVVIAALAIAACGQEPTDEERFEAERQAIKARAMAQAMEDYARSESVFGETMATDPKGGLFACKASIGELMSQSPSIMSGKRLANGRYEVSYIRSDGTSWRYRCRATANELQWATVEDGRQGNWRGGERIRYEIDGSSLALTLRDLNGDDYKVSYSLPGLRKQA